MAQNSESILDGVDKAEVEATLVQRFFSIAVDVVFEVGILIAFYLLIPREFSREPFEANPVLRYLPALIVVFGYRFICIFLTEKTIGMRATKIKYLNGQLQSLSTKEKFTAVFRTRTSEVRYYKNN